MNRFLSPERLVSQATIELDAEQSHHALQVMRHNIGDAILLIDGEGGLARATVKEISGKKLVARVESIDRKSPPISMTLAFGICKPTAIEFIIRRCTEVGVTHFQPLITDHSLSIDRWHAERWNKIAVEVCKQCERLYFPKLLSPIKLSAYLVTTAGQVYYCSESQRNERPKPMTPEGVVLLIGPEGGWSDGETQALFASKAAALGLGKHRLRTEMAALAAVIRMQVIGETIV